MPSFIFDSKSRALTYAKWMIAICVVTTVALETSSDFLLKRHSPTYDRISREYKDALTARHSSTKETPSVLMVGNSLLLHGVELDRLQALTCSRMRIYPVFLEATGYYDWFYALQRMFQRGARPDVVVVGVGVSYFLKNGVRQDYVPMMFFDAKDTLAAASDMKLDRTETSNLWLEHSSTFWDTRNAIRLQVLKHMVPGLEGLFSLVNPRPAVPEGREFEGIAVPRLRKLRELCESNGAKLILLLPPTLSSELAINQMTYDARAENVEVSVPVDPATLSEKFYQPDGMHLNHDGAAIFTSALAKDLPEKVLGRDTLAFR